jgi:hypothetical protein
MGLWLCRAAGLTFFCINSCSIFVVFTADCLVLFSLCFSRPEHIFDTPMSNTVFRTSQRKPQPATEVTLWVHPFVKTELKRLAELDGLSVSKTGATLLEDALHQKIHLRQAILFEPMIERAIAKQMQGMSNRLAWLLVRIAFDVGKIRGVTTNILGRQQGVNEDILKTILQESSKAAKMSITRQTPQLTELMKLLKQWLQEQEEGKKA